jgi:pilus assembly protein CpaE
MKFQALVVAQDPVYLNWLQNAVEGVQFSQLRPIDSEDLLERVEAAGRIDLVLFEFDAVEMESRAAMMERLLERQPEMPVAAIGAEPHPDVVLAAMRAGARDFLVLRRDDGSLSSAIGRLVRRGLPAAPASRSSPQCRLFTLLSGHPYEGIAFTATHLALALVEGIRRQGERVLLLDTATPAGASAVFLNLAPGYSVLDALNDVYRCDQTLVDTAFTRHGSGLYVLSLPEDLLGRPALEVDDFLQLLKVLRTLFDVIVCAVDGHAPLKMLSQVASQSSRLLWLTDQSILRSRLSKYLLRALRLQETPVGKSAGLLVDAYQRRLGLEPSHLAELLDLPLIGTLTGDPLARVQAMNAGESLLKTQPRDGFSVAIRALAETLMTDAPAMPAPAAGSLLQRWLS